MSGFGRQVLEGFTAGRAPQESLQDEKGGYLHRNGYTRLQRVGRNETSTNKRGLKEKRRPEKKDGSKDDCDDNGFREGGYLRHNCCAKRFGGFGGKMVTERKGMIFLLFGFHLRVFGLAASSRKRNCLTRKLEGRASFERIF